MNTVFLMQEDEALQAFAEELAGLPKQEIPVQSWMYRHEGELLFGPHFRICFKDDGTCAVRTAWDKDAEGNVVQHDYLMQEAQATQLKGKFLQLFGGPALAI